MAFFRRELKNGITVLFEQRELPVVAVSISNRFGAAFEEAKIKGIAHFIEHLVFTGTKTRSHEDISREIEKKGGVLNAFTAHEITSFWFKMPSEHIFSGLEILKDILVNPSFDLQKFEKEKKVILEEIKMYHDNPQLHVHEMIHEALYEPPFGSSIVGNEKTINALKRDFVYQYFNKKYCGKYLVTIVGNADFDRVCSWLEEYFTYGKEDTSRKARIILQNKILYNERESIDQAHFVFGVHAPIFGTRESYVLEVLDAWLANGMSSRLFLTIREERGLAYAIKSSIQGEKSYSMYSVYVGTTKKAIPEVERLILDGFSQAQKLNEQELKEAKERLIGLRKLQQEESAGVMQELLFAELSGKAETYYQHEENISAVTLKEVQLLARDIVKKYSTAAIVPK